MQRIIGIDKINRLRKAFKRPLVKSCIGEMLPDFSPGFDVTNWYKKEYFDGDSDIPLLLRTVNKYCPTAKIEGVYNMGTQMLVNFGRIELHLTLKNKKIIKTQVTGAFGLNDRSIKIEFEGNDLEQIFRNKLVKNNTEYAILKKALEMQYGI